MLSELPVYINKLGVKRNGEICSFGAVLCVNGASSLIVLFADIIGE